MFEKPDPLVPEAVNLRGMPYMPLDIIRLFDSDFYALSNGDEFKAGLSLWCKAFLQSPAGSLPNDDRLLAHLSGAGRGWNKVKGMAMRGWILCNDNRLYHPTVAEKVMEAWAARQERRARTEAARAARQKARANNDSEPTPSATDHHENTTTEDVTSSVTEVVTSSKGREGKGREGKYLRKEDSEPDGSAPCGAGPVDARSQLWSDGLGRLRSLTGKSDPQSRRFLGGLLKSAGDDCALVNAALEEAADLRPIDPAAWLTRRIRGPDGGQIRNGFLAIIAQEGMPSTRPTEPNRFLTLENSDAIPH